MVETCAVQSGDIERVEALEMWLYERWKELV